MSIGEGFEKSILSTQDNIDDIGKLISYQELRKKNLYHSNFLQYYPLYKAKTVTAIVKESYSGELDYSIQLNYQHFPCMHRVWS